MMEVLADVLNHSRSRGLPRLILLALADQAQSDVDDGLGGTRSGGYCTLRGLETFTNEKPAAVERALDRLAQLGEVDHQRTEGVVRFVIRVGCSPTCKGPHPRANRPRVTFAPLPPPHGE